jgi:RND family efflux transporter MFP subunit
VYEQQTTKKREIEGEITKCQVYAPQDGLVVYYIPEQAARGGGSQQSVVAQGEPVREGQKMIQIPDLSLMLANVRVPEAFVAHLHSESDGESQPAQIRVDAFPNRILKGHVKTVDTVASQTDWFNADVKVYKTMVAIDHPPSDLVLKPGMSAEITISAEETSSSVLVVPVQAVIGTINMGAHRKCFVIGSGGQPELRDIEVGLSNERMVEVRSGLEEGDRVVENPRTLLSDDSEMKPGKGRNKSDDEDHGPGTGGGQKKGKGKKGGGGPGGPDGFKGGPSPGGPATGAPSAGGAAPSAEMQQKMQQFVTQFQNATPEQRRDIVNGLPAEFREKTRKMAQEKGWKIAD